MSTITKLTAAAAIGVLGSVVAAPPASAVVVAVDIACPIGIPTQKTEIKANITCQKWDNTTYSLVGMQITVTGQITGSISLTNKAAEDQIVSATTSSNFAYGAITGFTFTGLALNFGTGNVNVLAGTTSSFPGLSSLVGSETKAISSNLLLPNYEVAGLGTFNIALSTLSGFSLLGGGGNVTAVQTTNGQSAGTVRYFYDDGTVTTPEPTAMAILGIGLLGLGAARRRRRQG